MRVYLNNKLVPLKDARISPLDHGFLYGDGIYETMRVYDRVVFMMDEHIKRLEHSAFLIGLDLPKSPEDIKNSVYETLEANNLKEAYVRVTVSRGEGPIGLDPALCPRPTYFVLTEKLHPYPERFYENGLRLLITKTRRNYKEAQDPQIKSLSFLNNILAKVEVIKARADEALMLNYEGFLSEGTVSNVFFVKEGPVLCTPSPDCGVLRGITRDVVLEIAHREHIEVMERRFTPEDIFKAHEVFITSTIMEVMPVGAIDNAAFPIGEVTKLLAAEYRKEVEAYVSDTKAAGPSLWGYQ